MAEAYKTFHGGPHSGESIEHGMAYHRKVQWQTRNEAYKGAQRARVALNTFSEERTGASGIEVNKNGTTNWVVTLTDTRSQGAANIIEFGRKGNKPESLNNTRSRPVAPLQRAFGIFWSGGF